MTSPVTPSAPATHICIRCIGQIAVVAHDVERAVRFYRDALGLTLLFQAPPGLAFFDCGGVRIMLAGPEPDANATSIIYYAVDDIQAAHAALGAKGVPFMNEPHIIARMPDHDLWMAAFHDSEGNVLQLMCEAAREGGMNAGQTSATRAYQGARRVD